VLITIVCPICESRWHVDAALRGRQMRCPNANCREVFEVREAAPPPEPVIEGVALPSPPPSQKTGQVGEMVPVLGAEVASPPQGERPQDATWRGGPPPVGTSAGEGAAAETQVPAPSPAAGPPDWRKTPPPARPRDGAAAAAEPVARPVAPPPVRARGAVAVPPPAPAPASTPQHTPLPKQLAARAAEDSRGQAPRSSAEPVELPPGGWDAPPVRGGAAAADQRPRTSLEEAAAQAARAKKRRHFWGIVAILASVVLVLGGGIGFAVYFLGESEDRDREAAEHSFAEGQFDRAIGQYAKLVEKYPDSERQDEYRFFRDLCAILVLPMRSDPEGAFDHISTFLKERKDHPLFAAHGKEVGEALLKLLADAAKSANDNSGAVEAQAHFERGQQVLDELRALHPDWAPKELLEVVEKTKGEIADRLRKERERLDLIARLRALAELPPTEAVRKLRAILRAEVKPPLDQDPEVKKIEEELYEKHRKSIGFTDEADPGGAGRRGEDVEAGLLVQPVVAASGDGPKLSADRVVFALARGVLSAMRQSDGDIQWARRVGIDTAHLPLRVPRAGSTPELALVLSADTLTLTGVNVSNNDTLWKRPLGAASLGRPVLVGRRVYVPTLGGEVLEIEVAGGKLLGRYKLGPSLSAGGARFGETKQIFFPGDDSCVYVLDVGSRRCEAVLYTDHAAGSLRGEPILLPSEDNPAVPGYLVLSQAHGLDATLLRTFRLLPPDPAADPAARESRLRADPVAMPERRLRGWPWFPPYRDPEKLVTVTDAGVMGLFGIVQVLNKDDALFPLVRLPDREAGTVELSGHGTARGRAQVVFARENDLWVLARGRLLRYLLTLDNAGPRVVPDSSWAQPLDLGSPLHDSQTDDDGRTLFLVTQSPNGQACLATAVDAETGRVRWQRQLGLVCHGDPQRLGDMVVALDQGGGLFLFDPTKHPADLEGAWQSAGRGLAKPLPEGSTGSIWFVPGPDGQSVYEFACLDPGNRLIVREYRAGQLAASEYTFELPARLAGTPAVGEQRVLLPLVNGDTRQVRLPLGSAAPVDGPTWRASRGDTAARGHAVWLGGEDFLTTNGRSGLTRWRFLNDDTYEVMPEGKNPENPTLELAEKVAGAPVILSRTATGSTLRVCVADERGTVYLFEGEGLKPARQWELKESITAGPFVRGGLAGCVVGGRRLVWLDPAKDDRLWSYDSPGEGIIGQPQIADGLVLVADVSGRFVSLDPATGRARGPGYQLRASVGPGATPVGFGTGRAFAPLTDGTVLLLPLRHLREPLPGLPPVW